MKTLVLSGINLFEAGPLSIYYDCLDELLKKGVDKEYKIVAFVHKLDLFKKYEKKAEFIELPDSRDSYIKRLWYEYFYFYSYSKSKEIDVWISLHDITPRVKAKKLYTYCHNPSPFMKKDISKIKYSPTNVAFSYFYKYLYRINIKSATAIIVQQNWMRKQFLQMYPIHDVIVARPNFNINFESNAEEIKSDKCIFMFASYPRFFKNFEVICESCRKFESDDYEVWLTLDGTENIYSEDLKRKYGDIKNIKWLGIQPRDTVFKMYNQASALIFPSVLESWGLPISEFKLTGKPMFLADMPYAKETLGTYDKVSFFDPKNANELSCLMESFVKGTIHFSGNSGEIVDNPFAENWSELLEMILG
ncbi:MAG: glycosyltransferase [Absicoccus porci]|uniref:glycosyltransferase n=1 Tax=Absicoccus porci TaxID=2486576 RepID=UPI0023F33563|nr:glycosyltransferase [Absicoccus porci]MDD7331046.1 glycosyltransferase [Absicoccus porci]MDY4738006.1 glycosyltransferase [Absicoccus porci]